MSKFIEKYFSEAQPDEVLFQAVSTHNQMNDIIESFYYFVKTTASEPQRDTLKACAYAYPNAEEMLIQIKDLPKQQGIDILLARS
ncbi:hypothetical protein [Vibrio splendidus]|uniref:Uncharacterized protein n=1 Tax=Vibrio splendidus TaxID=29497 RepID=A0A2T5E550_VIBSP|nr:hypothetical protein [Vibrio splendidus]OEE60121.1 hypothetical protein A147_03820 [Vibrio splendidus FF-6]PTP14455.1 hypothetical protein CWO36_21220 [Vibrio splendidus]